LRSNSFREFQKQLQTKISKQLYKQLQINLISCTSRLITVARSVWVSLADRLSRLDWPEFKRHGGRAMTRLRREFFYIDHKALAPYLGLLVITCFVFLGNQANQQALASINLPDGLVSEVEPEVLEGVLTAIDPLTPEIDEAPQEVASLLVVAGDGGAYLPRPEMTAISEAESLSKKDLIPYTIQQGDTMVSIAKANGRTVATILEANNIKPEDAGKISPGITLFIPQEDTSDSLAWLEADQRVRAEAAKKRAEQQAKGAAARKSGRGARTTRERSDVGYDGNAGGSFIVPINHNGITRGLGRGHTGIDYRADTGTGVVAAASGRVVEVTHGWAGGWGNSIVIDHGGGWTTRYAHLASNLVGVGATVGQGDLVGYSGNTGRSTGPHLHFEARVGGRAVQPF
jgi:murein DD-endopeptidase MepM/ murein hydrolase activator NlpD